MKRLLTLILLLTLLVITGTIVSADWTSEASPGGDGQTTVSD